MLENIKVNEVSKNLMMGYKITIAGVPKIGKTTLFYKLVVKELGNADQGLIVAFENGYNAIQGAHIIDIENWVGFQKLVKDLVEKKDEISYKCVCIDTSDIAMRYARQWSIRQGEIQDKKKYYKLNDMGFGAGHEILEDEFSKQMGLLEKAGYGIFYVSHHKDRQVEEKDGTKYDRVELSVSGKVGSYIKGNSDFIIFIDNESEKQKDGSVTKTRSIRFRGDGTTEAGGRMTHLPEKIPYDVDLFIKTINEAIQWEIDNPTGESNPIEDVPKEKESDKKTIKGKGKNKGKGKSTKPAEDPIDEAETVQDLESPSAEFLQEEIGKLLKAMDKETLDEFKPKIKDILGVMNYNKVDDVEKLQALLSEING